MTVRSTVQRTAEEAPTVLEIPTDVPSRPPASHATHSREQRAELLAAADRLELVELAEACLEVHGEPTLLVAPETGLVMVQVREPVCDERFHAGEVLVTRAEVDLAGHRGWAMRMGNDRVATLAAAICDAVAESGGARADDVRELCLATARRIAAEYASESAELAATTVSFEELD